MTTPAAWHSDPDDPELARFWDGGAWTDQRKPVGLHLAEQQLAASLRIAKAAETIRGTMVFFVVIGILGAVLSIVAVAQASS